jgi:hypothetical protein
LCQKKKFVYWFISFFICFAGWCSGLIEVCMKRPLEPLKLDVDIPDVKVRVPLPMLPRVFSVDEQQGSGVFLAATTPLDVQNASNKRVYRSHEWGKNVFKASEPFDPLEHLSEEDKQIVLSISYAKNEMAILGQFADAVADGQRMQIDYVPVTLPLEKDERALRAARFAQRKAALADAAVSLKAAAARLRKAIPQDQSFYGELRRLRRNWTLEIVGGARFTPTLSAVCGAQCGVLADDSSVPLTRFPATGSVQVIVPALLRPRLCVNKSSAWPKLAAGSTAVGVTEVHAMLVELQRCHRSKVMSALLRCGTDAAAALPFASVRNEGNAIAVSVLVKAACAESFELSMGQPEKEESNLIEVHLGFLLSKLLRHYRSGVPLVFGERHWFGVALASSGLGWVLLLQAHERYRRDAEEVFARLSREQQGLSVFWGGSDLMIDSSSATVVSNVYFKRNGKRVVVSMIDAGASYHVDGNATRRWGLVQVTQCVLETLK